MADKNLNINVNAQDKASGKIDRVADKVDEIEGSHEVEVTADTAEASASLDDLAAQLDGFGGPLGNLSAGISRMASPSGAVGALITGLAVAANHAADVAIEADNLARLTGDSVEAASRLNAVWKSTGADTKDLQDVLLQMNGVLAEDAELAAQLGINLGDGASIGQRFEQVVAALDRIPDAAKRSQIASRAFGEEGVRQVNALVGQVGDLSEALGDVPDGEVMSAEDVEQARQMKEQMRELTAEMRAFAASIGSWVLPAGNKLFSFFNDAFESAEAFGQSIRGLFDGGAAHGNRQFVDEIEAAELAAREFDMTLLDGLTTFDAVRQKVIELGGHQHTANLVALEWKRSTEAGTVAAEDHASAVGKLDTVVSNAADAMADAGRQADDLAGKHRDAAEAAQEQVDAIDDLAGRMTDLVGGEIAVEDAQARAKKAVEEYETAAREGNKTEEELAELRRRAQQATLDAAKAAGDYEADQRRANGETLTAADIAGIYAAALGELATVLDPSGRLRQNLAGYKQQLDDAAAKQAEIATAQAAVDSARTREQQAAASGVVASQIGTPLSAGAVRGEQQPVQVPYVPASYDYSQTTYILTPAASAKEVDNARRDWEMRNGPGTRR